MHVCSPFVYMSVRCVCCVPVCTCTCEGKAEGGWAWKEIQGKEGLQTLLHPGMSVPHGPDMLLLCHLPCLSLTTGHSALPPSPLWEPWSDSVFLALT